MAMKFFEQKSHEFLFFRFLSHLACDCTELRSTQGASQISNQFPQILDPIASTEILVGTGAARL
jgi:hypothetical protein